MHFYLGNTEKLKWSLVFIYFRVASGGLGDTGNSPHFSLQLPDCSTQGSSREAFILWVRSLP